MGSATAGSPGSDLYSDGIDRGRVLTNQILEHHGVKGMKWGVRRGRSASASLPAHSDHTTVKEIRSKPTHSLSNKELQTAVTRLNLEQQYHRLSNQSGQKSKGRKIVEQLLGNAGKQQAQRIVNELATQQVNSLLKK